MQERQNAALGLGKFEEDYTTQGAGKRVGERGRGSKIKRSLGVQCESDLGKYTKYVSRTDG